MVSQPWAAASRRSAALWTDQDDRAAELPVRGGQRSAGHYLVVAFWGPAGGDLAGPAITHQQLAHTLNGVGQVERRPITVLIRPRVQRWSCQPCVASSLASSASSWAITELASPQANRSAAWSRSPSRIVDVRQSARPLVDTACTGDTARNCRLSASTGGVLGQTERAAHGIATARELVLGDVEPVGGLLDSYVDHALTPALGRTGGRHSSSASLSPLVSGCFWGADVSSCGRSS